MSAAVPAESPPPHARAFATVFASSLASHVAAFLFVHLPGFLHDRGASEEVIGRTAAVTALTAIGVRPFVGPFMDRRGRKPALVVGGLLHALTSALYLFAHGPGPYFTFVRAVHGMAFGIFFSAVFSAAADLSPAPVRTQRMAIFGISGILPMSLGAVLGSHVLARFGHTGVFTTATACAALGCVLATTLPETRREDESGGGGSLREAVTSRTLVPLWIVGVLFSFAIATYFVFVRNFVSLERGVKVDDFFTPYAVVAIFVRVAFGSLPARIGEARAFTFAVVALSSGLVALGLAEREAGVRVAGALCGLGHAFAFPSLLSLFVERSEPRNRGTVISLFTALMDVGVLLAGPCLGPVADARGFPAVFFVSACVALLAAVIAAVAVVPGRPQTVPTASAPLTDPPHDSA